MHRPHITLRETPADGTAPLLLRPWTHEDAAALVRHHRDPQLRAWLATHLDTTEQARAWVDSQHRGWAAGTRAAFAVVEDLPALQTPVGHVALTATEPGAGPEPGAQPSPATPAAPVRAGYWTAPEARGRRIASRALVLAAGWAAGPDSPFGGRTLELVHAVGNEGSCRTALAGGFALSGTLPASPGRPRAQHLHTAAGQRPAREA
ncbi:GNAT family N-acetyltransferase [Streptomyces tanashiensis]|uniref:GNAT family N-acetyltransferase n=1 Tax=Streptomyces tanashiensis TaxID=67367 RepID=UPI00167E3088|nr:GNAT family N-acetyltransferase [Streptomyces tanashiensis]GGY10976.1 acetyltransferase [Streptomyces tanashiensis]